MQKIAILGGGIGALATAAELTSDLNWQQNYDITIYQMGWRLGGKGASGRNRNISDRIQEHGIHLWMGFYENAFQMIRQVYDEAHQKNLMPQSPFTDARKAFSPMNFTPMMEQVGNTWKFWNLSWPGTPEFPGDETTFDHQQQPPTPLGFVKILLSRATAYLDEKKTVHPILVQLYQDAASHLANAVGSISTLPSAAAACPPGITTALHCITAFTHTLHEDAVNLELAQWIKAFNNRLFQLISAQLAQNDDLRRFFIIMDTGLAAVAGMIADGVIQNGFMAIEDIDFIDWLTKHGCRNSASPISLGMYDACFGYQNGDPNLRRMGAGSTLYGGLRLMFTYRGALMWWMNAGMGETVMSPIYLVLKSRGVKFKFFHKVKNLHLSADSRNIDSVDFEIQATTTAPNQTDYDPLFLGVDGVPCWPTEPLWDQINEADKIKACQNPDLESWWTDWKGTASTIARGADYDLVVLGISLGAHKYICQELIAASPRWKNSVANVGLVRTQGLQIWMNKTLAEAGWPNAPGVLSGYVEPFDTWSDMSHLIARERWPASANAKQVAYFCNAFPDQPLKPFDDPTYPETQRQQVKAFARKFLDGPVLPIFPAAEIGGESNVSASTKLGAPEPALSLPKGPDSRTWDGSPQPSTDSKHFNDNLLVKCIDDPTQTNFDTQFFRVNIDPSELYVLSLPGSATSRLSSHDSDFDNLYLAGDWTLTDLNIGCIEATVISARMASRAICGKPDHIYGAFGSITPIVDAIPPKPPGGN